MTPLEAAIDKIDIPTMARHLGVTLLKDRGLMSSPFREDRIPSFSIYDNGHRFKDFGTGECGNIINFIELATGKNRSEAAKYLIEMAGTGQRHHGIPRTIKTPSKGVDAPDLHPLIPSLEHGSNAELAMIAQQRGFPVRAGIEVAYERGLFGFCDYRGHPSWVIKDPSGRVAQARRLDGHPFDNGVKAMTLKHSKASWPVGYSIIGHAELVIITEGTTDFLTAFTAAWLQFDGQIDHIAFCSILGATQKIHPDALKHFEGKPVIIYADNDPEKVDGKSPGIEGAKVWRAQLRAVTDNIAILTPDIEGYDLNDEARIKWAEWDEGDPWPDILRIEMLHPTKMQQNVNNKTELYNEKNI